MQDRIEWIDIAKGIGILLVIAGHTISLSYSYPVYAFHMPLFFFLSGLVFNDKNETFVQFLIKISKSLLRPWAIILFISFLVCMVIPQWRNAITIKSLLSDFYTANSNTLQNSSLWYLICFFFVLILFYPLKHKISHSLKLLLCIMAIALLWQKEVLQIIPLPFHRLPFKIDSALIALVFFTIAFHYKNKFLAFITKTKRIIYIVPLVIVSAVLCALNGWTNINSLDFGRIRLLYYPIAIMGILCVSLISEIISASRLYKVRAFLSFYGKNSLLIFGFQSLFIRLYLLFFNNIQHLDMKLYGDNPILHQLGSFTIVSFILSPFIVFIFNLLRKHHIQIL